MIPVGEILIDRVGSEQRLVAQRFGPGRESAVEIGQVAGECVGVGLQRPFVVGQLTGQARTNRISLLGGE